MRPFFCRLALLQVFLFLFLAGTAAGQTACAAGWYASQSDWANNSARPLPPLSYNTDSDSNQIYLYENTWQALRSSGIDSIWGMCINGTAYIKVHPENQRQPFFVRIYLVGKISYFYYKVFVSNPVEMKVYNPYTGKVKGTKTVMNRELTLVEKMLRYDTGEIADFDPQNFKLWIRDDERLLKTVEEMPQEELLEKLFKTLRVYNDRNPIDK